MNQSFSTSFTVDQSPAEVFAAINNVRGWWSEEIEGHTDKLGEEFEYHFEEFHRAKLRVTELIPNKKVVWLVVDNYFSFIEDKTEWMNSEIVFEIAQKGDKTEVQFTHIGLVPENECYEACSNGWTTYMNGSLPSLINTGIGKPNAKERPTNETERKLVDSLTKE